jgi:hypothetical protein
MSPRPNKAVVIPRSRAVSCVERLIWVCMMPHRSAWATIVSFIELNAPDV